MKVEQVTRLMWESSASQVHIILIILQVNEKSSRLRMVTYRDGVKRKGDKIGMGL